MPKSSGSGPIASTTSTGSGNVGATVDISRLADRFIERIQQARSVTVQIPSSDQRSHMIWKEIYCYGN